MNQNIKNFIIVFLTTFSVYVFLFIIIYISGFNKHILQSEDILPTAVIPFSIINEQNLNLNEYYDLLIKYYPNPDKKSETPYYLKKIGDNYYSFFPQFTSFIVTPLYIIPAILKLDNNIETIRIMSRIGGAFITALSTAFFWLALKTQKLSKKKTIILLFIYAFCTNSLSTSSQGLWQHGTSQLFLSIGLFAILSKKYAITGLMLGLAFITRPTNLLPLMAFPVYIYFSSKEIKSVLKYSLFAFIPVIFEIFLETGIYGSFLNSGYAKHTQHFTNNIIEGFIGMWLSPSKGILFCSPVLIFMFYGFYKAFRNHSLKDITFYLTGIILVHTMILGSWYNWFGGYSWGYRMASDIIPFMVFMLIPFINSKYFSRSFYKYIFLFFTGLSFLYHLSAFIFFDPVWHILYDGKTRYWLWSIENSQIVFSIKRLLYKFSLMENPVPMEYRSVQ